MESPSAVSGRLRAEAHRALKDQDLSQAQALFAAAVQADPTSAAAHHDLGGLFKVVGRLDEAERSLRAAYALAPNDAKTRHALGTVLLSQGRYREGWPLYDARHEVPELGLRRPQLPYAEWRGEAVDGKSILIFPEQGLGDQIQFARFAPWLAARGADVTLLCDPRLADLFADSLGVRVLAASGQVEFPDPDLWVMSGSLTGRSGLEPGELPNAPYLCAPSGRRLGAIGVATRGNPVHANDANRSLSASDAARLLALPGAVSLLPEHTGARSFAETAALIAALDLVISVDTSVAHLAAAMGKPTWILLPALMTDWRWMQDRSDSPWYPSAKLFRQPAPGDWASVFEAVEQALSATRTSTASTRASEPPLVRQARAAARMIPRGAQVLELTHGAASVEPFLPEGCVIARDATPINAPSDVVVALEPLEGRSDARTVLRRLRTLGRTAVISYQAPPEPDLLAAIRAEGFAAPTLEAIQRGRGVAKLVAAGPSVTTEKSVWVLSFNNADNFGDRLGVRLLSKVLPPHARVRHVHHAPWDAPPEGDIDLLVLGIGNSLFGSLVTDQLLALMDRARTSIGFFGTQFRSTLPPGRLAPVLDRLDLWWARSQEDLLLYGKGRANARHMGDWLIQEFPLVEASVDETLEITSELVGAGSLDRIIEMIQERRRVFSPKLHPLLCALCSAEEVAFREQRIVGDEPSGKFRSLLLDVFGIDKPELQFWPVDRAAVLAYKTMVDRNVTEARAAIEALLDR